MVSCKVNCFFVCAIIYAGILMTQARPQIDYEDSYPVDGFIFDGPADRNNPNVTDGINNMRPPMTSTGPSTPTTTTMSSATTTCLQNCLATSEFNPVCGSDGLVYSNPGRLGCARACGKDVRLSYYGTCSTSSARG
ncbi:uncharacterized protein LOC141523904 [Cotesia typhae]